MDYFMSTVRKAAALHPKIPVVIDMAYVSIADFTTAYVRISNIKLYDNINKMKAISIFY